MSLGFRHVWGGAVTVVLLVGLGMFAAACSDDETATPATTPGTIAADACDMTSRTTSDTSAPSATRMFISRRRFDRL